MKKTLWSLAFVLVPQAPHATNNTIGKLENLERVKTPFALLANQLTCL
ncbi:MAG: hypothetical protein P1U61_05865 [Legionellaceae bacterium]|nr:hypothetical protein [Legionellaceae bacterium]